MSLNWLHSLIKVEQSNNMSFYTLDVRTCICYVLKALLNIEHVKKYSCLKPQGLAPNTWYVASPSKPLPILFKLYPGAIFWPAPVVKCFT